MHLKFLSLIFVVFLVACNANSQKNELISPSNNSDPNGDTDTDDTDTGDTDTGDTDTGDTDTGDTDTGDTDTGDTETGDTDTGDTDTGDTNTGDTNTGDTNTGDTDTGGETGTKADNEFELPSENYCVADFSPANNTPQTNSTANFLFYQTLQAAHAHKLSDGSSEQLSLKNFNNATPYQVVTGSSLASWRQQNSGFWLTQNNVSFANVATGEIEQISNLDLISYNACKITQVQPSLTTMAELHVQIDRGQLGNACDAQFKVDLSLNNTADINLLPDFKIHQGQPIYNISGEWLGSLTRSQKSDTELVPVLSFTRTDMCKTNRLNLVDFEESTDTWYAKQFEDGRLLLRIGSKVYLLSASDTLDFVLQKNNFNLPIPLYVLPSFAEGDFLFSQGDYLYYTYQTTASLYRYQISTGQLSTALAFLENKADPDPVEEFVGFRKLQLDDNSLWVEGMFSIQIDQLDSNGAKVLDSEGNAKKAAEYWHRFKRLDLVSGTWDVVSQLDHIADSGGSHSKWHSINNKAYVKIRALNNLYSKNVQAASEYVSDYLLVASTTPLAVNKIWHFLQLAGHYGEDNNTVLALDFSDLSGVISLELQKDDGSSLAFTSYNNEAISFSPNLIQGDYLTIQDIACTTDCTDISLDFQVTALNLLDGSVRVLHTETISN